MSIQVSVTNVRTREFNYRKYSASPTKNRKGTMKPHLGKIYFWMDTGRGYNPLEDMFSGERYNKQYTLFKKQVLPWLRELLGINPDATLSWSKNAGCTMCPCSPAFIVRDPNFSKDVHVDYRYTVIKDEEEG